MEHLHFDDKRITFPKFNPGQRKFVYSKYPFPLGSGGYGSGKTDALCCRAILLSVDSEWFGDCSGAEGILGRYKQLDFKKTTLTSLRRILPEAWIARYWDKDGIMLLKNGSIIHLTHLDSKEHLQSYNLSWAGIDQAEQVPWDVVEALALERVRRKSYNRFREDGTRINPIFNKATGECLSADPDELNAVVKFWTVFGVCNARHGIWTHERFKDNEEYQYSLDPYVREKYNPEFKFIDIPVFENKHNLPGDYIERQRRNKSAREFARDVDGSYDAFEGKVYIGCTRNVLLDRNLIPHPSWDIYVGIDHGGTGEDKTKRTNLTAVVFLAYQHRAGQYPLVYIFDELYLQSSTIEETVAAIDSKLRHIYVGQTEFYPNALNYTNEGRVKVKVWRCDPSMKRKMDEANYTIMDRYMYFARLRGLPMPLLPGDDDWKKGVEMVDWMFRKNIMKICPKCTDTYSEHASLEYGENEKIKPMQRDHAVTAVKYVVSAFPRDFNTSLRIDVPQSIVDIELAKARQENRTSQGNIYGLG